MKNLKSLTLVRHLSREKSTLRKTALWQLHKGMSLFSFLLVLPVGFGSLPVVIKSKL